MTWLYIFLIWNLKNMSYSDSSGEDYHRIVYEKSPRRRSSFARHDYWEWVYFMGLGRAAYGCSFSNLYNKHPPPHERKLLGSTDRENSILGNMNGNIGSKRNNSVSKERIFLSRSNLSYIFLFV